MSGISTAILISMLLRELHIRLHDSFEWRHFERLMSFVVLVFTSLEISGIISFVCERNFLCSTNGFFLFPIFDDQRKVEGRSSTLFFRYSANVMNVSAIPLVTTKLRLLNARSAVRRSVEEEAAKSLHSAFPSGLFAFCVYSARPQGQY